jgi:chromosome segregation ATPase
MNRLACLAACGPALLLALAICGCVGGKSQPFGTDPLHSVSGSSPVGLGAPSEIENQLAARGADMEKRLNAIEEDRKSLVLRLQQLESALEEKDRILALASQEVQASSVEVQRTRAELEQWKKEMTGIRDKARASEQESATAIQGVVGLLEQMVHDDKAVGKETESETKTGPN